MDEPSIAQPLAPHRVRRAERRDVTAVHAMVVELADFECSPASVEATADDLRATLFGGPGRQVARAHVVEVLAGVGGEDARAGTTDDGASWRVAGIAVRFSTYSTYSTWTGRAGIWLEDLCVGPRHRGLNLGRALLAALAATCTAEGHRRLEWTVLDWNTPAEGFCRRAGAAPMDGWTTWRLDGDALAALAATAEGRARLRPGAAGSIRRWRGAPPG